jgi:hypothetical protein
MVYWLPESFGSAQPAIDRHFDPCVYDVEVVKFIHRYRGLNRERLPCLMSQTSRLELLDEPIWTLDTVVVQTTTTDQSIQSLTHCKNKL